MSVLVLVIDGMVTLSRKAICVVMATDYDYAHEHEQEKACAWSFIENRIQFS